MAEEGGVGKQGRREIVEAPRYVDPDTGEHVLGEVDPAEVEQVAADFATVVRRVGGVCSFGAHRVEVEPGIWQTEAVIFNWSSRAPGQHQEREQLRADIEESKSEPELEPVAAE